MVYPTTRYICSTRNQQAIQQYEHWWFGSVIWELNGIPTRGFAFWMMTPNDKHTICFRGLDQPPSSCGL